APEAKLALTADVPGVEDKMHSANCSPGSWCTCQTSGERNIWQLTRGPGESVARENAPLCALSRAPTQFALTLKPSSCTIEPAGSVPAGKVDVSVRVSPGSSEM